MIDLGLIVTEVVSGLLLEWLKGKFFGAADTNTQILRVLANYQLDQATRQQVATMVGGYLARLGAPLSSSQPAAPSPKGTHGTVQRFKGGRDDPQGASVYVSAHGAFPTWGNIAHCYEQLGGTTSRLGFPISVELMTKPSQRSTTGQVQRFEGLDDSAHGWDDTHQTRIAVSIYSSRHGTYPTWGAIGQCYERLSGTMGRLGFPTSPEFHATPSPQGMSGYVQRFEGCPADTCQVSIYASERGTWPVWGEMACRYEARGGTSSDLGFPLSAETQVHHSSSGETYWIQHFEGGDLRV